MPELSGQELLRDWKRLMDAVVANAASLAGHSDLAHQLLEPMQRQLEIVQEIVERERRRQHEIAGHLMAPVDAVFDLLEGTAVALGRQAEALEAAGRALEEASVVMRGHAQLFEQTVGAIREPAELAKAAAGLERRPRKRT